MGDVPTLKAPYPWPGGKGAVADVVWERFGDVDNAIEPFAGSLAWLLRRPAEHFADGYRVETMNDVNHYVVNFWRCLAQGKHEEVARWADNPVTEADLHARHRWLVRSDESYAWKLLFAENPDYCDPKVAGLWCWGLCCWIGSGWCDGTELIGERRPVEARGVAAPTFHSGRPQLADAYDVGRGVNGGGDRRPVFNSGVGALGYGVNAGSEVGSLQRPDLNGHAGCVYGEPTIGTCDARREWLTDWMRRLADRLRLVRTCYGHWSRVCDSESTLTRLGTTGVFLDPPYPTHRADTGKKSRAAGLYASDKGADLNALRDEVLAWCKRWGGNPGIRTAVCGYEGDGYEALEADGWEPFAWSASGGYGNQAKGKGKAANADRERIWFSPHCVPPPPDLFAGL